MKFGTITQTGLELSSDIGMFPAQYSANIQVDIEIDSAYQEYTPTANVGYPSGGPVYLNTSLAIKNNVLTIEPVCFKNDGVLVISLAFTKENEVVVTHPINIPIVGAPGASIILPPSDIWQQQVSAFVQSYLSTEGITISATAVTGEPGTEARVENTGTGTKPVFKFTIPQGEQGDSVGSIQRTSGTGAAGTTDTYTIYDDDGETIGKFTVYNGANGDGSGDFMANGSVPMTGDLDMGGRQIQNLAAPTASTDAATMGTVETIAIKETATGEVISVSDSADYRLLGLKLYGKSVQNGTPTPESPVEIESAGDSGNITVTLFDGAEQSQTLTYPTLSGLPGIPVESGGNFTDAEGQQWYCDIVDFAAGTYTKYVDYVDLKNYKFTNNSVWTNQNDTLVFAYSRVNLNKKIVGTLSNKLVYTTWKATPNLYSEYQITVERPDINKTVIYVTLPKTEFPGEINSSAINNYLSTAGIYALVPLKTPIETNLTPEQITAYSALTTYKPNTTITTGSSPAAGVSVDYIADTKTYIDNKLAAISEEILGGTTNGNV